MIWLNFDTWNSKHGYLLSWKRIYKEGKWTPFCHVGWRFDPWYGYWKKPKSITWLLAGRTIIFAHIPSDAQMQAAIDAVRPLGLVPTDQAFASGGMFELYLKPKEPEIRDCEFHGDIGAFQIAERPDWVISVPDGHARTASVTYKGAPLNVISAHLHLQANDPALLTLEVWAHDLEATMSALDIEIGICE